MKLFRTLRPHKERSIIANEISFTATSFATVTTVLDALNSISLSGGGGGEKYKHWLHVIKSLGLEI